MATRWASSSKAGRSLSSGAKRIAAALGFSETVFVDDFERAKLAIFTPARELPFAGHPLVGTAWLIGQQGQAATVLRPPAGEVASWQEGDRSWIRAPAAWSPAWDLVELPDSDRVEALSEAPGGLGHVMVWAWENKAEGRVRARAFASQSGVREEATSRQVVCELEPVILA